MKAVKAIVGLIFEALTMAALAVGIFGAAVLSIVPGLLWLLGDLLSDGHVSKWLDNPFKEYCQKLKESL